MPPSNKCNKWTDKMERDMLIAMIMVVQGGEPVAVSGGTWEKVAELMVKMGHNTTSGGMSQRWTKVMQKDFLEHYRGMLKAADAAANAAAGAGAGGIVPTSDSAPDPTQAPVRRVNRTRKREPEEEEINDSGDGDEADFKKAPAAKKQKKN